MVTVATDLGTLRESARRERFEPTGTISATNVQKAIEQLDKASGVYSPVAVVSTANIAVLTGLQIIDGYQTVSADRVLLKDQSDPTKNGIYVAAVGAWSRASDMSATTNIIPGRGVFVLLGTQFARTLWQLVSPGPLTLGSSALNFALLASSPTTS